MRNKTKNAQGKVLVKRNETGFSLTELLIVITVIVIVSTLALLNIGTAKTQLSRQNVALELKSAFERARFDSVKRRATGGASANVIVSQNSFTLNTDVDQDGAIAVSEARVNSNWAQGVAIFAPDGSALGGSITVTFDNRGEVTTSSGSPTFLICNGNCSTPTIANSQLILITKTGTVNSLPGGDSAPSFSTPSVTTIPSNNSINPDVKL